MPKPKIKKEDEKIKIKSGGSSLSEFIKRTLPKEDDAEKFERYAEEEAKNEDIEESLSEIYQDGNGRLVDVKKLDIKKRKGPIFRFFSFIFMVALLAGLSYIIFSVYQNRDASSGDISFLLQGKEKIIAGEEFFYAVDYKNLSNAGIGNIEIKLNYPDNFIFLDSSLPAYADNSFWKINSLEARRGGQIKIKGKIIAEADKRNIITGIMSYTPDNFSSEFKKEAAFENILESVGLTIMVESDSSALLNEENEIKIKYKAGENNYIKNFRLSLSLPENIEVIKEKNEKSPLSHWQINEIITEEKEIIIKFKVVKKINPTEELVLAFEYSEDGGSYYKFFEKKLNIEIVKNNLNLNLIANGSRNNQGADFGQVLNYSITYANKGDMGMKDVVIMAVLKGEILDWSAVEDKYNGQKSDGSLSWSKTEISGLELIAPGEEGIIDFSISALPAEKINIESGGRYEAESYAQFSISGKDFKDSEDTKSNTITIKINSDLSLDEQVRYFNDDNITVGFGPLSPKAGTATGYKIYWKLTNNLHELNDALVQVKLPDYVFWDNKNRSTVGSVSYDEGGRKVIWNIGRMPISVYKAEAEFNISITPSENDVDKILVLTPGASVSAFDIETGEIISKQGKAKTTRLEDDDIAETDGRVVK